MSPRISPVLRIGKVQHSSITPRNIARSCRAGPGRQPERMHHRGASLYCRMPYAVLAMGYSYQILDAAACAMYSPLSGVRWNRSAPYAELPSCWEPICCVRAYSLSQGYVGIDPPLMPYWLAVLSSVFRGGPTLSLGASLELAWWPAAAWSSSRLGCLEFFAAWLLGVLSAYCYHFLIVSLELPWNRVCGPGIDSESMLGSR